MASLYELSGQYAQLLGQIDIIDDPEYLDALYRQLDALDADISLKGENYARVIRNTLSELDALTTEIKRFTALKQARENTVTRLKDALPGAMQLAGATTLGASIGSWRIQRNPASVTVLDEAAIPTEYLIPQPAKVDKRAILAVYKATGEIPEGVDITQTEGLRFR